MEHDEHDDQTQSNQSESQISHSEEESSESIANYVRRQGINNDNYIELILAGRQRKLSIAIPALPQSAARPRRLILNEDDFGHLLGEVDGSKYGSGCRPELELVVLSVPVAGESAAEHTATIVYDAVKDLFVYALSVECQLLRMLHASEGDPLERLQVSQWFSLVNHDVVHAGNMMRMRSFRRLLRRFILPVFQNDSVAKQREQKLIHYAEMTMRARNAAMDYSDTDSAYSSLTPAVVPVPVVVPQGPAAEEKKEDNKPKGKVAANRQLVKGISRKGLAK